ncbi:MAG: LuxR C-terminal-related transcriptional regulator [Anaerolineae bacterium]|jgi:LuxR family maltose regulon positive regulatory protein
MSFTLLETKLYVPPVRPGLVPRPHLCQKLDEGLRRGHRLALLSAPAGSGKTTLLSEWLHRRPEQAAWLSLDAQDDEPARFWTYLIAALQTIHPHLGQGSLKSLQSFQAPSPEPFLAPLLNELAALAEPCLLVLDDYHLLTDRAIHDGLAFFLEHQPAQVRLVISTRADPPLPIFRLRARGQLTELRSGDLRFTPAEAATFLSAVMGLDLAPGDVEALEARTEGWIVGLQLAALSLQGQADAGRFIAAFTGSHRYVLEYLTEEVVRRQPEPVRRFLIQTSVLDRLCGPLCDAVTGGREGVAQLAGLHSRNLFLVPLDGEQRWYRYHHLFADLLANLLRKELSSERIAGLHRRASAWYEQNEMPDEAIQHALQAGDPARAADLIEQALGATLSAGGVAKLVGWAEALPEEVKRARPRLRFYQAWTLFLNGQLPLALPLFQEAEEALAAMPPSPGRDSLRGELAAMQATISVVVQQIPEAMEQARQALDCLPPGDLISRARATRALGVAHGTLGDTEEAIRRCNEAKEMALAAENYFLAAEILSQVAAGRLYQGRLRQAARTYQEIVDLVDPPATFPPACLGYVGLADVALEWNRLDDVARYLEVGIELCRQGGIGYGLRPAYCVRAIHRQAVGDVEGALEAIHLAEQFDPHLVLPERAVSLIAYQVRLQLLLGDVQEAARWVWGAGTIPAAALENLPIAWHEWHQVSLARVHLARGEPEAVVAIHDRLFDAARAAGRLARVVELGLLRALALEAIDRPGEALDALAACLALAEPGGYLRLFLEAGEAAAALLRRAAARQISPGYTARLLAAFGEGQREDALPAGAQSLVEPLTPREREVLHLICEGLANREIAERLTVTLHTVKKHSSHIYGKLGVGSRAQAIVRARDLGLHP